MLNFKEANLNHLLKQIAHTIDQEVMCVQGQKYKHARLRLVFKIVARYLGMMFSNLWPHWEMLCKHGHLYWYLNSRLVSNEKRGPNACIISIAYDRVLNFQSVAYKCSPKSILVLWWILILNSPPSRHLLGFGSQGYDAHNLIDRGSVVIQFGNADFQGIRP